MADRYCTYCTEAVTKAHFVHELRSYCCDSDDCQRELQRELRAAAEEAEYRAREDDFDRYR